VVSQTFVLAVSRVRYIARRMNAEWLARWRDGRIGFHEAHPNAYLERYAARFAGCPRVLVPLCGKAEDLAFLAALGHEVVGVELAEQAVREFFADHGLVPDVAPLGPYLAYRAGRITLLVGDIFALTAELAGPIDALYDRAALVALPAALRPRYVELLRAVVPAAAAGLVITIEYDESLMEGPPFAVHEAELRALFAGCAIDLLDHGPATGGGKCTQSAVSATQRCFAIRFERSR
jgi:thiopurine S-methyltransferase